MRLFVIFSAYNLPTNIFQVFAEFVIFCDFLNYYLDPKKQFLFFSPITNNYSCSVSNGDGKYFIAKSAI